jgi:hypothetical protein
VHADSYFTIGKTHRVCQDYAKAGMSDDLAAPAAYVVLSDGCSSSPDSDFGARLMVLWGADDLQSYGNTIDLELVARSAEPMDGFPVHPHCLDATLLALFQCRDYEDPDERLDGRHLKAILAGDGVLAGRRRDGSINYWVVSYRPGPEGQVAPAYPSYLNDEVRLARYLELGHGITTISEYLDGELVVASEKIVHPEEFTWDVVLDASEFDFVALFSDGVESFYTKDDRGRVTRIPVYAVLQQAMAVKGHKGSFVTRRCQRFFERFCPKNGWEHADDFSMAAIWCRED